MKKFFALALLSSLTFQTRAVDLQDLGNLVALPGVLSLAASQAEGGVKNLLETAAEGSAYATGTRAVCYVEGNGLDSNFQDLSVDSALYTGLLLAEKSFDLDSALKLKKMKRNGEADESGLVNPKVYSALKLAVYAAAVNVIRAGIAQVPVAKYLLAAADEVKAAAPVVAAKVQTAASAVATAAVQKK